MQTVATKIMEAKAQRTSLFSWKDRFAELGIIMRRTVTDLFDFFDFLAFFDFL